MAGRKFTSGEDRQLVEFYEVVGANVLADDMERSPRALADRVSRLKTSGAWDAYYTEIIASEKARFLAGHMLAEALSDRAQAELASEGRLQ